LTTDGTVSINGGNIGGWSIRSTELYNGSGNTTVCLIGPNAPSYNTYDSEGNPIND